MGNLVSGQACQSSRQEGQLGGVRWTRLYTHEKLSQVEQSQYKFVVIFKENEKVLAIGDNLRTDIKGANNLDKDCLFISDGVHRDEYINNSELENLLNKYKVKANYFQKELKW